MGTYTTNYNLFMPTVGETGWGTLVNGNFSTIDTTMKSLSNRITTCESYGARVTAIENEVNGNLSCTSVTTSGKVTANGGITSTTGTFSGAVTGASFNNVPIKQVITVTPNNNYDGSSNTPATLILPPIAGRTYTGTIRFYVGKGLGGYYGSFTYKTSLSGTPLTYSGTSVGYASITLNNAKLFMILSISTVSICDFTLS